MPFDAYTYDRGPETTIDCDLSRDLAAIAGVRHTLVSTERDAPAALQALLNRTTYYDHHHSTVADMRRHFGSNTTIAVTANLLEIGRYFFKGKIYQDRPPETPELLCEFGLLAMGLKVKQMEAYEAEIKKRIADYFADFIRDTDFNAARGVMDPRDQFYWEFRMSSWHGMILLERDFYADCFIPFNSRAVFEALLGVPVKHRKASTVFKRLIRQCAPQLATIPINPPEWPLVHKDPTPFLVRFGRATKEWAVRIEQELNQRGFRPATGSMRKLLRALGMRNISVDLSKNNP